MTQVRFEQAVYGSFPFRGGGYAPLAHSPGCKPEWLAAFASACQKFGEPSRASSRFDRALFSLPLARRGPWLVVGVSPSGEDDRGRPGALGFHGLFLTEREFRKIGFNPFALSGALRSDWSADATLAAGSWPTTYVEPSPHPIISQDIARAIAISAKLKTGRRVALESTAPLADLADLVWVGLTEKERKTRSVATWAFANGNRFDLVAVPRLEMVDWDQSYSDPPPKSHREWAIPWRTVFYGFAAIVLILAAVPTMLWMPKPRETPPPPSTVRKRPAASPVIEPPPETGGPDRSAYRDGPADPSEAQAVARGLVLLADRFGVVLDGANPDPTAAMVALSEQLRYRGRWLSDGERAAMDGPGRSRALAWEAHVRLFAPNRKLPLQFSSGTLRWKLDTLLWTFHLDPMPRVVTTDLPHALADALSLDNALGPNPLESRYPALSDYRRFLARLPRR